MAPTGLTSNYRTSSLRYLQHWNSLTQFKEIYERRTPTIAIAHGRRIFFVSAWFAYSAGSTICGREQLVYSPSRLGRPSQSQALRQICDEVPRRRLLDGWRIGIGCSLRSDRCILERLWRVPHYYLDDIILANRTQLRHILDNGLLNCAQQIKIGLREAKLLELTYTSFMILND
jgi:hypothetical protein